jgi:glucose-6-phosphate dehydrogenase assembly protein OpcA
MENSVKDTMARVYTATVVAIVSPQTKDGTVATLSRLSRVGVRPVIISLGERPEPGRCDEDDAIVIDGLLPKYLDNAVASLRLSSLPTLAWWRAGDPETLKSLAALVDRVVLDVADPSRVWPLVPEIAAVASVSDVRWTRLTRLRELLAQFFDIPEVRALATTFDRLQIAGSDPFTARLAAGWLRSRLPAGEGLAVRLETIATAPIESLQLSGGSAMLRVRLMANNTCVETSVQIGSAHAAVRVVAAGDQRQESLIAEELRVRSRDLAFEDAVRASQQLLEVVEQA